MSCCPSCETAIFGVVTRGPGDHRLSPCGCEVTETTVRELADQGVERGRGVATDGGPDLATHEFRVRDDMASIVYGPWDDEADEWMLGLSTADGERVRLLLAKQAMYELWTEVQHVPWPREEEPRGTLQREIVEKVNGMDEDLLREVLETVDKVGGAER